MFCNRVAVILGGTPARGGKGRPGESVGRGAWERGWGRCHVIVSVVVIQALRAAVRVDPKLALTICKNNLGIWVRIDFCSVRTLGIIIDLSRSYSRVK